MVSTDTRTDTDAGATPDTRRHRAVETVDRGRLARDLAHVVEGEVRFDPGAQALYANDASIYRQVPIGVVIPRHAEDVVRALEVCRRYDAPVLARGCGTGLAGQSVNAGVIVRRPGTG